MTRNNTQEKKNISAKDSWRSWTRQLRMQRRIEIGSTTNSHIRRGNKSDCHDLIVLAHAPSTRVPPNGTSLALEQACTVSYPRNIPSRHPRSVLSESRRDTTLGFLVYRFVRTVLNSRGETCLSGNATRKVELFERWRWWVKGMHGARFRERCFAIVASWKDPGLLHGTASKISLGILIRLFN